MASETYERLAAQFDTHHKRPDGLTYLSGEQIVSRLNDVLGPSGWSWRVTEHGFHEEADEFWALGELRARIDGEETFRSGFGSQKCKRPAAPCTSCGGKRAYHEKDHPDHPYSAGAAGIPLDIGFDLKGAATDALKKAATLIGVGLYLSSKEEGAGVVQADAPKPRSVATPTRPHAPIAPPQQAVQNGAGAAGCPKHGTARLKPSKIHAGKLVCSTKQPDNTWCNWEMDDPAANAPQPAPGAVDDAEYDAVFEWGRA